MCGYGTYNIESDKNSAYRARCISSVLCVPASPRWVFLWLTMLNGWVRNWRQIEDWEWYTTPNMAHLFQHLIRRANRKPKRWQGIKIEVGQLITSQESLRLQTGLSRQIVRTCLGRLKSTSDVTIKTTNTYTLITISNYKSYQSPNNDTNQDSNQDSNQPPNQRITNEQPTDNQRITTNKNIKKYKKEENQKKEEKRGRFTPPSPQEVCDYGKSIDFPIDGDNFIDFYTAKGWMIGKNKMKDWKAAVRTWKRRDNGNEQGPIQSQKRTTQGQAGQSPRIAISSQDFGESISTTD